MDILFTQESKEKYLKNPEGCPFCEYDEVSGSLNLPVPQDDMPENKREIRITSECMSLDCGKKWIEIYSLTNIMQVV